MLSSSSSSKLRSSLLDSSLIIQTQDKQYTIKLIKIGEYYQLYYFHRPKIKKDSNIELLDDKKIIDNDYLIKKENYNPEFKILDKNINRSKFQCSRLVKANENIFKTFITLTFADNITDIKSANKKFNIWLTKIRSIKKDFAYVGVPEFQKRGAVHYHLLSNLEINVPYSYFRRGQLKEVKLIMSQENKKNMYDVKYWPYGFSSVFSVKNINVVAYMTKYMTKDIDNRLFGSRRYFHSRNLIIPEEYYIDLNSDNDFMELADILSNNDITYENSYLDVFGDVIDFVELKKRGDEPPGSPRIKGISSDL